MSNPESNYNALLVGIVCAVVGAVAGSILTAYLMAVWQTSYDEVLAEPALEWANAHRYEGGDTILTFRNTSRLSPVAITSATFSISDQATLARIAKLDPPPDLTARRPCGATYTQENDRVVVEFTEGYWCTGGRYEFTMNLGQHIDPSSVGDVHLRISNRKWAGETFIGDLTIHYSGNPPGIGKEYSLNTVTIQPVYARNR